MTRIERTLLALREDDGSAVIDEREFDEILLAFARYQRRIKKLERSLGAMRLHLSLLQRGSVDGFGAGGVRNGKV